MRYLLLIFIICFLRFIDGQGKTSEEFDGHIITIDENGSGGLPDTPDSDDEGNQDSSSSSKEVENGKAPHTDTKLKESDIGRDINPETVKLFLSEVAAGEISDLIGQNQHIQQSPVYHDLGRRSNDQGLKNKKAENDDRLIPEKAPPELVLLVAKESALLRTGKDDQFDSFDQEKILRSGDYWNGVWKEEVIPKSPLRSTNQEKKLIEPLRYEVAPEYRFLHYPSMYYRRNEVRLPNSIKTSRKPITRRKL